MIEHNQPDFTSSSFESGDLRIAYLTSGQGSATAIVFLHGGGLSGHTWKRTIRELGGGYFYVAPDLRGHGDSDWDPEGNYELHAHAEDVERLCDRLSIDRYVLVGMSLGGAIALTFAASHSSDIEGLVLVDTGPGGTRSEGRARFDRLLGGQREFASMEQAIAAAHKANPGQSRQRLAKSLSNNMKRTEAGGWTWKFDPNISWRNQNMSEEQKSAYAEERKQQLWSSASQVFCPVLVIRGEQSEMFLEEDADRTVQGFRSARKVTIPGAGHFVQRDCPKDLAVNLGEWIEVELDLQPS